MPPGRSSGAGGPSLAPTVDRSGRVVIIRIGDGDRFGPVREVGLVALARSASAHSVQRIMQRNPPNGAYLDLA